MLTPLEDLAVQCLRKQIDGIFITKKDKKQFKIHSIEDGKWVFLEVKTDVIIYVSDIPKVFGTFIQIPSCPKTWEEYCKNHKGSIYYLDNDGRVIISEYCSETESPLDPEYSKNIIPSEKLAEAFLAMMQLMSLRQAWIGDWVHNQPLIPHWCIIRQNNDHVSIGALLDPHPLEFPTEKMTQEFLKCFKDLINTARPLL